MNAQEPRTTILACSNPGITSIASDAKRILCISFNLLFRTLCASRGSRKQNVQDHVETLAHELEYENKELPSVPVQKQVPVLTPPTSLFKLLNNAELLAIMSQMSQTDAKYIYTSRVKEAM